MKQCTINEIEDALYTIMCIADRGDSKALNDIIKLAEKTMLLTRQDEAPQVSDEC